MSLSVHAGDLGLIPGRQRDVGDWEDDTEQKAEQGHLSGVGG